MKKFLIGLLAVYVGILVIHRILLDMPQDGLGFPVRSVLALAILVAILHWLRMLPIVGDVLGKISGAIMGGLAAFFGFLWRGIAPRQGARFMPASQSVGLLNRFHQGFVLDGKHGRLSQKASFQSVVAIGGMGKGKSTTQVIPNLLTLDNCSMVVTDTSGELYQQTSGYLAAQGFDVQVLNLINPQESFGYNPLHSPESFTDVQKLAHLLIDSAEVSGGDPFWGEGAKKILRILIQCLKNREKRTSTTAEQNDLNCCNLANLRFLLNHFDAHNSEAGQSKMDQFVMENTLDDPTTFHDYRGFTTAINPKTMLSFLSTADTALAALANPELCQLTAQHDFDFKKMRTQKTVIYVLVQQQDLSFYRFLLNAFYTDLIRHLLLDLNPSNLPVYLLLDEFGHLKIPDFPVFATTARKYKVGLYPFLQSLSQLEAQYGREGAATIMDGLQTEVYFSGVGLDTARSLSQRIGQKMAEKGHFRHLMTESEIIRMKDDEVLILHSNKEPMKRKVVPFYKQSSLRRRSKMAPCPLPKRPPEPVRYINW